MFRGDLSFLSNMHPCDITILNTTYPSLENAYQALKCKNIDDREMFENIKPREAKELGATISMRSDWDTIKKFVMEFLLKIKFSDVQLLNKLINTPDEYLVETNLWHDNYWGDCVCSKCSSKVGSNNLGRLLLKIKYDKNN